MCLTTKSRSELANISLIVDYYSSWFDGCANTNTRCLGTIISCGQATSHLISDMVGAETTLTGKRFY